MTGLLPIDARQALGHLGRALRYVWPVRRLYLRKLLYGLLGIVPAVLLPWPAKVIVDHVILQEPLDLAAYPAFFRPVVAGLEGATPVEIVVAVAGMLLATLIVFGGFSTEGGQDTVGAGLAEGTDLATRSENAANTATSGLGGLLGWLEFHTTLTISHALNHHLRSQLFRHIQRLPMTRLTDQRIGDAMYRVMYDTPALTTVATTILVTPLVTLVAVAVTLWIMQQTSSASADVLLAASLTVPIAFLGTLPVAGFFRRRAQEARATGARTTVAIEESLANVAAVQGLGSQSHERERFDRDSWRSYARSRAYLVTDRGLLIGFLAMVTCVALFLLHRLSDRVFEGTMSIGDLSVLTAYFGQLVARGWAFGMAWVFLQGNVVGLQRVFELIDEPPDYQPAHPRTLSTIHEGLRFEDVGFTYPDGTPALRNVSFEARVGTLVAVVGPAGAGKTTLAQLVPRFLRPTTGHITVDGVPLEDLDRTWLRQQIAFVFQEPTLFDATVAENLRLARPDATDDDLWRAARDAGAAGFIEQLPDGLATRLGRDGGRLSIGQKQRLAIARALVRASPVLVLDEPTAALDPDTETHLVETLRATSRSRLVVVVAHRLSTIRHADHILFLEDGRIHEHGTHEALCARDGGHYRRFVELQARTADR